MAETRRVVGPPPTRPADDIPSRDEIQRYLAATTQNYPNFSDRNFVRLNPEAMQQWLADGPRSTNIDDRRDQRLPTLRIGGKLYR